MTVSEVSDRILDDNFGLELSHSEGTDSTPSDVIEKNSSKQRESNFNDESDGFDHYGILGMKWGVRRSKDGLGYRTRKRRFRDLQYEDETPQQHQARLQRESNERVMKTQTKAQEKSEKRLLKSEADKQKRLLKSQEKQQQRTIKVQEKARQDQQKAAERQRKEQERLRDKKSSSKRQDPKSMTDQELRDAINRVQLERQYKRATGGIARKTLGGVSDITRDAGKKIVTALIVTYGTKVATKLIDEKINKRKRGGEADG